MDYSIVFVSDRGKKWRVLTNILLSSIALNSSSDDIHAVIPKEKNINVSELSSLLEKMDVKIHRRRNPLLGQLGPRSFEEVGWRMIAGKIKTKYDKRLVLDTDTMILKDPYPGFPGNKNFAFAPTQGGGGPSVNEWKEYYSFYDLEMPEVKIIAQDGSKIVPFWNGGVLFFKKNRNFIDLWIDTLKELEKEFNIGFFSDMIALPALFS